MKRAGWFTCPAVTLAVVGLSLPQLGAAEQPGQRPASNLVPATATPAFAAISDVALAAGGVLRGQLVDVQGLPLPNQAVVVRQQERILASARSDQDGRFSISGLPGGVYQLAAADAAAIYRFWAPGTAPPVAQPAVMLVAGQSLVRGQSAGGRLRYWMTSPWVLAGALGALIITPIALNNREKISTS